MKTTVRMNFRGRGRRQRGRQGGEKLIQLRSSPSLLYQRWDILLVHFTISISFLFQITGLARPAILSYMFEQPLILDELDLLYKSDNTKCVVFYYQVKNWMFKTVYQKIPIKTFSPQSQKKFKTSCKKSKIAKEPRRVSLLWIIIFMGSIQQVNNILPEIVQSKEFVQIRKNCLLPNAMKNLCKDVQFILWELHLRNLLGRKHFRWQMIVFNKTLISLTISSERSSCWTFECSENR